MDTSKKFELSIKVRDNAQLIFLKARPASYALKEKVKQELQRLEEERDHLGKGSSW